MADEEKRPGAFRLRDLPDVDPDKLSAPEVKRIEAAVLERDQILTRVRTDLMDLKAERDALQNRLEKVEVEKQQLHEKLRQMEDTRPKLEPRNLIHNFGEAVQEAGRELEGKGFAVKDYEVELKTNVVYTDEGIRLHLPGLAEEFASQNLSTVRFGVKQRPSEEETYVEVPDLRGLPEDRAAKKLRDAGLTIGDREMVETGTPGTVQDQYPEPYALTTTGTDIDLTISGSPKEEETKRAIEEKKVEKVEKPAEEETPERETSPQESTSEEAPSDESSSDRSGSGGSNTSAEESTTEDASSKVVRTVPKILGTDIEEARAAVADAGLTIGTVFEKTDEEEPGTVIVQEPDPGEEIKPGTEIDLAVAKRESVTVPELTGLRASEARRRAREAGFVPRVETKRVPDTRRTEKAVNTVTKQVPAPGSQSKRGSDVTLTVLSPPKVDRIRDIGKKRRERLGESGVETVDDLATSLPDDLSSAIGSTPVARRLIETAKRYRDAYDLTRVRGIGTQEAEALADAGVTNPETLASTDPEQIHATLKKSLGKDAPDMREVRRWVKQVKRSS